VRRFFVLAALGASLLAAPLSAVRADTLPGGVEGCVVTNPGKDSPTGTVYADKCSYTATRTAGYATAAQKWSVSIYTPATKTTKVFGSDQASKRCYTGPLIVTATNGVAAAGNPFPAATDGKLNPSDACGSTP
jgi:hypothetical protein